MVSLNGVQPKDAGDLDTVLDGTEIVVIQAPAGGVGSVDHTTTQAIADLGGGGGGAVDSVNGETGVVVLDATDVGADPAGSASAVNTSLTNHLNDSSDAHDASAVSFVPAGTIAATNVQAAIEEVAAEAGSGSLTDAVILAPDSSARNVIEGDGDVTELTLKADTGQTAPIHEIQDEDGNTLYSFDPNGLVEVSPNALGDGVTTPRYRIVTAELGDDGIDVFQVYSLDLATVLFNLDSSGGVEADLRSDDASWFISSTGRSNTTPGVRFQVPIKVSGFGGGILFDVDLDGFHVIHAEVVGPNIYDHGIDVDGTTGLVSLLGVSRVAATVGQTDPILDFQDENEATVAQVHIGGAIGTRGTEPADGDIAAGECFRWFDATNGAACVKFKGKQANGTVVTCTIPMT